MKTLSLLTLVLISASLSAQTILAEHHYKSTEVTNVVVKGSFCDVIVSEGDAVEFDAIIEGSGDKGDYVIGSMETGNTVVFTVEKKVKSSWNWNMNGKRMMELKIPKGTQLTIDNSSGDIKVEDYSAESLEVSASSGDIMLRRISANCDLGTTSGDLIARDIVGDITNRSTSGDQEYSEITGNVTTRATSGDIEIYNLVGNLKVSATSGDIELDGIEGAVSANTTSGNIDGDDVRVTDDCRFKSTSGDISIGLSNDLESLSFDLRASSGDLQVGRIRSDDDLVIDRNGVTITGISTSGDQSYTN